MRLVILSGDPLVAAGLGHLVEEGGDAVIVSDAADAEVALIDAGRGGDLDGGRGLEALAELPVPAVVLVGEEEDAAAALAAGARGALLRTSDPGSLWAALVAVRAGLTVLDADSPLPPSPATRPAPARLGPLAPPAPAS